MQLPELRDNIFDLVESQKKLINEFNENHTESAETISLVFDSVINYTNQYCFVYCTSNRNIKKQLSKLQSAMDFVENSTYIDDNGDDMYPLVYVLTGDVFAPSFSYALKTNKDQYSNYQDLIDWSIKFEKQERKLHGLITRYFKIMTKERSRAKELLVLNTAKSNLITKYAKDNGLDIIDIKLSDEPLTVDLNISQDNEVTLSPTDS